MGKASSAKKVARAAKAGGGKARSAGERNFLFPVVLALVVVLGVSLVWYARDQRLATALERPTMADHWHSAYGFYVCDTFLPPLPTFEAPRRGGNHTHGDGLIHIHPFSTARAGAGATLVNWMSDAGEALGGGGTLSSSELAVPGGQTYRPGDSECEGMDGDPIVQVAVWNIGAAALAEDTPEIVTSNLSSIRFDRDGQVYTIAFAPEGTEIPPPDSVPAIATVGSDLGVEIDERFDEHGNLIEGAEDPEADDATADDGDAGDGDGGDADSDTGDDGPDDPEGEDAGG